MSLFGKKAMRLRDRTQKWKLKLGVELFEERLLLSQIPVTNTQDAGAGSLRAAITAANSTPGSEIVFQIPGPSPVVIDVTSAALPTIIAQTTIDGTTESTFLHSAAVVQINGGGNAFDGLTLGLNSDGSTITGLNIADFKGNGINVQSGSNTISDDLIGTDPTGLVAGPGNATGILVTGSNNVIGGTTAGAANTIAYNAGAAVTVDAGVGNAIRQNLIYDNGSAVGESGIVLTNDGNNNGNTTNPQLAPMIVAATSVPGLTTIQVSLPGFTPGNYEVDFYASALGDSTANQVQAHVFLGFRDSLGRRHQHRDLQHLAVRRPAGDRDRDLGTGGRRPQRHFAVRAGRGPERPFHGDDKCRQRHRLPAPGNPRRRSKPGHLHNPLRHPERPVRHRPGIAASTDHRARAT